MTDLPAPLTPPECDLRGMPYMPLDIVRLFDSDLYALSTGDEFKAALTLWGKSFLQIPAGSLPSDERILAHLSGTGANWKKVRDMALRGWVKCNDNRLHHPVVAEKAKDAWDARVARRTRTEAARAAKLQKGLNDSDREPEAIPTDNATRIAATSVTEKIPSVTELVAQPVTGSKGREGKGREEKEERLPSSGLPHPACAVPGRPEPPPDPAPPDAALIGPTWPPPPLAASAVAEVGGVVASLTGRRRGTEIPGPARPARTVPEQISAVASTPAPKPLPAETLATLRRHAGIGGGG